METSEDQLRRENNKLKKALTYLKDYMGKENFRDVMELASAESKNQ